MPLTFLHITDTHLGDTPGSLVRFYSPGEALRAVLRDIERHDAFNASFMIHTGDLIRDWNHPAAYDCARTIFSFSGYAKPPGPLRARLGKIVMPWYYVPGNVDVRPECVIRLFGDSQAPPVFNYAWEINGIRFLSVDWGVWRTDEYTLTPETFDWLRTELRIEAPTVIATHHPPVRVGVEMFDRWTPPDLHRLQDLLASSSVIAIIHGHTHHPWENRLGNALVFGTGSVTYRRALRQDPDGGTIRYEIAPPQYRIVTVNENGSVSTELRQVSWDS